MLTKYANKRWIDEGLEDGLKSYLSESVIREPTRGDRGVPNKGARLGLTDYLLLHVFLRH